MHHYLKQFKMPNKLKEKILNLNYMKINNNNNNQSHSFLFLFKTKNLLNLIKNHNNNYLTNYSQKNYKKALYLK